MKKRLVFVGTLALCLSIGGLASANSIGGDGNFFTGGFGDSFLNGLSNGNGSSFDKWWEKEDNNGKSWFNGCDIICGGWDFNGQCPAPVPEPATMLLVGSGLLGALGVRRKMQK